MDVVDGGDGVVVVLSRAVVRIWGPLDRLDQWGQLSNNFCLLGPIGAPWFVVGAPEGPHGAWGPLEFV